MSFSRRPSNEGPEMEEQKEEAPRGVTIPLSTPEEKPPTQKMPATTQKDSSSKTDERLDLGPQTVTGKPDPKNTEEGMDPIVPFGDDPSDYGPLEEVKVEEEEEEEEEEVENEEEENKEKKLQEQDEHKPNSSTESIQTLQPPISDYFTPMTRPVLQPKYILRGHTSSIHALVFIRGNTRLLSGDAEGWVLMWDVSTRRAVAVWRAHKNAILGMAAWENDKIITHGRDQKLCVWKLDPTDEINLSKILPAAEAEEEEEGQQAGSSRAHRPAPWLLHVLEMNTLNFCAFSMSPAQFPLGNDGERQQDRASPIYLTVPNALNSDNVRTPGSSRWIVK
ncbi:MAG: ATP-dependent RNA helicase dbp7 [Watsoniomyces obsoletus]|nr:MAG: ATP-dependent RNA helicase dbp7 [Watsoniomyces obsoletus]